MNEVDPRVGFYLEHRDQIEEWAALRQEVPVEADRFFRSLEPDVRSLAATLGIGVDCDLEGQWRAFYLFEPRWRERAGLHVAVLFGWETRCGFDRGYSGLYVDAEAEGAEDLGAHLLAEVQARPGLADLYPKAATEYCPAWRYDPPRTTRFWEALPAFRREIVDALRDSWQHFSPVVEAVLAQRRVQNAPPAG